MTARKSISIDGLTHLTAIPVATRIGPLLLSSVIAPFNPGTRDVPEDLADQYRNIFRHMGLMLEEAGADWRHVAKMEFWIPNSDRGALDPFWLEKFPDETSRPSRHTHTGQGDSARASFIAYICD
ncbi:MAG: RidA family protein [Pseudomonadota bacterium]|jgi:enamine deaminase RidA (YjgF/YER057c/UK114 family)|nr:RidA family protein [Pseudomonadota bacterium]